MVRTAVGITCGIGSMLVGARQAGFQVLGNVEWRNYYRRLDDQGRNTFTANFPGAILKKSIREMQEDEIARLTGCDVAFGHPECGAYSALNGTNAQRGQYEERRMDAGDIPLFTELVGKLRPRFFAMDDLPKSLPAYPMQKYAEALPDYDLFPEWVSNWGYGNIQKHRNRMFMIGALKSERFAFVPGEAPHSLTVRDIIGDMSDPQEGRGSNLANHDPHTLTEISGRGLHMEGKGLWYRPTWGEMRDWALRTKPGESYRYHSTKGGIKTKPGWRKVAWDGPAHVLTGVNASFHPERGLPMTIRERARIQGFPDDFVFYGTKLDAEGRWNHEKNLEMVKQTGKAMPVQFNLFFAEQVMAHLEGIPFEPTRERVLDSNELVDDAKRWYCSEVGYSNQQAACGACWLYSRCTLARRHGGPYVPPPAPVRETTERVPRAAKEPRAPRESRAPRPPAEPRTPKEPKPQPTFRTRISNL